MDKLRLLIVHPNTCWLVSRLFKQLVLPAARWLCIKYRPVLPLAWYCFSFTLIWLIINTKCRFRTHFFTFQFTRSLETTNFLSTAVWPIEPIKFVCKHTEQIFLSDCQLVPVQFQYRRKGVALEVDWEHPTAEGGGSQDCTRATTWVQLASLPLIQ